MQGAFFGTKFFKALESLLFLQRFNNEMLQMCARKINMRFLNDFFCVLQKCNDAVISRVRIIRLSRTILGLLLSLYELLLAFMSNKIATSLTIS